MKLRRFAVPALAVLISTGGMGLAVSASAQQGPPQGYYGQDQYRGDWDAPPRYFNDIQQRGFRDGMEGARKDYGNHRQPDVNNRDEYRHPDVPSEMREDYREGFRRGYYVAMRHLMYGGQSDMRLPDRPWDMPPDQFDDMQRQGFRDGMDGARKDYGNHRQPDVNNRDEYRHPDVPPQMRDDYRDGFRRGYDVEMQHLMGGESEYMAPLPPPPPRPWDMAPDRFSDIQRRGFQDGIEGARKDFGNHRRPDVENRDEYRHPDLPYDARHEYREGFRRGYAVGVRHFYGISYGGGDGDRD